jgi:hypothetical protein
VYAPSKSPKTKIKKFSFSVSVFKSASPIFDPFSQRRREDDAQRGHIKREQDPQLHKLPMIKAIPKRARVVIIELSGARVAKAEDTHLPLCSLL